MFVRLIVFVRAVQRDGAIVCRARALFFLSVIVGFLRAVLCLLEHKMTC